MSATEDPRSDAGSDATVRNVELKLEVVVIPVSDVDRAKAFYAGLGWRLDADFAFDNGVKVVQFTPPGSPGSVQFGTGMTTAAPGSAEDMYLIVSDIEAARDELVARGVQVSEVFHPGPRAPSSSPTAGGRVSGPAPDAPPTARSRPSAIRTATAGCSRRSPPGSPGASTPPRPRSRPRTSWRARCAERRRHTASTRSASAQADENWPDWYAAYMVAEQAGTELPT